MTARMSRNPGTRDRLFGHFRTAHGSQATVTDAISPLLNLGSTQPQYEGQLKETHKLGANAVNQFIASGQWYSATFNVPDLQTALQAQPYRLAFADRAIASLVHELNPLPPVRNVTPHQISHQFSL